MSTFTQQSLVAAITYGQEDFSDCQFVGPIRIDVDQLANPSRLIFDRSILGPEFEIFDWNNPAASLSMEGVVSGHRVSLHRLQTHQINLSGAQIKHWLGIVNCKVKVLNLVNAKFLGGFTTNGTVGDRLYLTACESEQSLFNPDNFTVVEAGEAKLGRLTPKTLGEMAG